ncbi:DUF922 domain-containing Zn-dependent protease [Geomonas sp. Red69]|uniref:DUF922 domain-containing protein n=1 Tax=Geomonas diazotrophica TaxID=2843197 RepID=UPI001C105A14|nr:MULTISPECIES: DUF922 domain-containing protein [Geomonas]MBU5635779.1 DUF922 domain-containing Zn-dependent protease [Geomonas diazotrophica]QXE87118.1 DUF922 domain-containing Zn-dependent protease [Geomonas nitrogeniifigens]
MMHRLIAGAGIALLFLASSSPLFASDTASCELKVREGYRFYDISGKTLDDLVEQIRVNGTRWNDGKVYSAMTNWDIHFKYDVTCQNGRYSVKSAATRVDILYNMPRLSQATCAPELAGVWSNYLVHLQRHEFGHKDLAVKAASEVNEMFGTLPSFASEEELAAEIGKRTAEKFRMLKEVQIEYDHDTRHGETQGAVLAAAPQ